MSKIILNMIFAAHLLLVLFVVLVPFTNQTNLLFLHSMIMPFIMMHWYANNNTCALTIMEKHMRYKIYGTLPDDDECFTSRLINPVYEFKATNENYSSALYLAATSLWLVSCGKLVYKYRCGKITSLIDLIMPSNE